MGICLGDSNKTLWLQKGKYLENRIFIITKEGQENLVKRSGFKSLRAFAKDIGIEYKTFYHWRNYLHRPSDSTIKTLSNYFGATSSFVKGSPVLIFNDDIDSINMSGYIEDYGPGWKDLYKDNKIRAVENIDEMEMKEAYKIALTLKDFSYDYTRLSKDNWVKFIKAIRSFFSELYESIDES